MEKLLSTMKKIYLSHLVYSLVRPLVHSLVILLVTLLATQSLHAQSDLWSRRHITMLDGLPTNTVRSITQDKDGFIWMGTDNGLCRYDGYNVLPYRNRQLGADQFVSAMIPLGKNLVVAPHMAPFS